MPVLLLSFLSSCASDCNFTTVQDLDNMDLRHCPPAGSLTSDTMYYHYAKMFAGRFNAERKATGTPELPAHFEVITRPSTSTIRWVNADRSSTQPYMAQKDIEWKNDTLVSDLTSFAAVDSLDTKLWIKYMRDPLTREYLFDCGLFNKTNPPGIDYSLTKEEADSILKAWKINY